MFRGNSFAVDLELDEISLPLVLDGDCFNWGQGLLIRLSAGEIWVFLGRVILGREEAEVCEAVVPGLPDGLAVGFFEDVLILKSVLCQN